MASENRCPKCGSEMVMTALKPVYASLDAGPEPDDTVSVVYRYTLRCIRDPKDCRIAELESLLRASEAREREMQGKLDEADEAFMKAAPFLPPFNQWSLEEQSFYDRVRARVKAKREEE